MRVSGKRWLILAALWAAAPSLQADEIKLKDGKKLNGVIVGYEDNMFRVKTDFGFVLVEKDKIAAIVPSDAPTGAASAGGAAAASATPKPAGKSATDKATLEPASPATATNETTAEANARAKIMD